MQVTIPSSFMDGKKTYLAVLAGVVYLVVNKWVLGQPPDPAIVLAWGGLVAAALRSGMESNTQKVLAAHSPAPLAPPPPASLSPLSIQERILLAGLQARERL